MDKVKTSLERDSSQQRKKRILYFSIALILTSFTTVNLFLFFARGILGYLDLFLIYSPLCQRHHIPFLSPSTAPSTDIISKEKCDQNHQNKNGLLQRINQSIFNVFRHQVPLDHSEELRDVHGHSKSLSEQIIHFCEAYQKTRSYFHIEKVYARMNWWLKRKLHVKGVSFFSSRGYFSIKSSRKIQTVNQSDRFNVSFRFDRKFYNRLKCELYSALMSIPMAQFYFSNYDEATCTLLPFHCQEMREVSFFDPNEPSNIIHVNTEHESLVDKEISSDDRNEDDSLEFPPPVLQIGNMILHWNSWSYPIVDILVNQVQANVVIHHKPIAFPFLHPAITMTSMTIGNATIEQLIELLPPPPAHEGLYPKLGIVNISNVALAVYLHQHPNTNPDKEVFYNKDFRMKENAECSSDKLTNTIPVNQFEDNNLRLLTKLSIPNTLFSSLLKVTHEMRSHGGIDQMHVNELVKDHLLVGLRTYLLKEDELRRSVDNIYRSFESWWGGAVEEMRIETTDIIKEFGETVEKFFLNLPDFSDFLSIIEEWEGDSIFDFNRD